MREAYLGLLFFGFDLHVKVLGKFIARAVADDCLPPAFISNLGDTPEESNQRYVTCATAFVRVWNDEHSDLETV